ncbi:hypothetical protein FQA39_LY02837 [Lamprigera yunnana]|nr:hypothetical protein FQA39_LY02837 [Lamprigera yunnana]
MSFIQETFTTNFFTKVFEKQIANFKKALNIDVSKVTAAEESFTSELLRIRVTYSTKTGENDAVVSVFVKLLKDDEELKVMNNDFTLYDNEATVYEELLPLMSKMGFKQKIGPKAYLTSNHPRSMLIIEDMSALGYKMSNRQEGLDLKHCLVVLKKLAVFHATSAVLLENNPQLLTMFIRKPRGSGTIASTFASVVHQEFSNTLSEIPGLQMYLKSIPTVEDLTHKALAAKTQNFTLTVLNHADLWCNNILFQYQPNGEVIDAVFVDYQLSYIGSPCIDLHYFFATSLKSKNKVIIIDTLLNYYFDELLSNLKTLNVDNAPTRKELHADFKERSILGYAVLCRSVPLMRANNQSPATLQRFLDEGGKNSFRYHCFNNVNYVEELRQLLPFYDNLGAFD